MATESAVVATSATNGVESIPAEVATKHPLQFAWTLWYEPPRTTSKGWSENRLLNIATFDTVEDFWGLFNNLQEPSQLPASTSYNLFKQGVRPAWEDAFNKDGGEWQMKLSNRKELLDEFWINTLMTVIGEGFEPADSDDIAGIVVNLRKSGDRLSIWTKSATNQDLQTSIGTAWSDAALGHRRVDYFTFKDQKAGRKPKPRYQVG